MTRGRALKPPRGAPIPEGVRRLLLATLILLALPALALARANPADELTHIPIEASVYDRGKLRKHLNTTVAHRDHIHIGMTKAGAAGRTSFWRGHTG